MLRYLTLLVFCCILFGTSATYAAVYSKVDSACNVVPVKDAAEALLGIFHKQENAPAIDTTPFHLFPSFLPGIGYSILTGPSIVLASNFSFYLGKAYNTNISSILFSPEYALKGQGLLVLNSNIWTPHNRFNIVGDNKYYFYTVNDYGLGPATKADAFNAIRFRYVHLHNLITKKITSDLFVGVGQFLSIHRQIQFLTNNNLRQINFKNESLEPSVSSALEASLLLDRRRNSNHPLAPGSYVNFIYRLNSKLLGSSTHYQSLYIDIRKYINLSKKRWQEPVLCLWLLQQYSIGKVPYWDMPSTMWDPMDNSGRPFIQGRFRAPQLVCGEAELRFNFTKNHMLGGAIWSNFQAMANKDFSTIKRVIPAAGASLRILVNKDAAVYFVISYGVARNKEQGLFLNLGEVF